MALPKRSGMMGPGAPGGTPGPAAAAGGGLLEIFCPKAVPGTRAEELQCFCCASSLNFHGQELLASSGWYFCASPVISCGCATLQPDWHREGSGGGTGSAWKITFKTKRKGIGSSLAGFVLIAVITQSATVSPVSLGAAQPCCGGGCWRRLSPLRCASFRFVSNGSLHSVPAWNKCPRLALLYKRPYLHKQGKGWSEGEDEAS